jgi:GNAT superfamily N-acetyltransferase
MQIVRADPNDAERLHAIAVAAKAHWGFGAAWMAEWASRVRITPEYLAGSLAFAATEGGAIVGWYALLPRTPTALLDHLWLLPAQIRRGHGRLLFEHALEQARALGAARLELEAEPNAVGFYQHMGATITGSIMSEMGRAIPIMEIRL